MKSTKVLCNYTKAFVVRGQSRKISCTTDKNKNKDKGTTGCFSQLFRKCNCAKLLCQRHGYYVREH